MNLAKPFCSESKLIKYKKRISFIFVLNFQAKNVGSSLAEAVGSIVNLKLVRSIVDVALDRLNAADRRGRADSVSEEKMKEQEELKSGITTVVGAALGEQECWERTACKAGEYAAAIPGQ